MHPELLQDERSLNYLRAEQGNLDRDCEGENRFADIALLACSLASPPSDLTTSKVENKRLSIFQLPYPRAQFVFKHKHSIQHLSDSKDSSHQLAFIVFFLLPPRSLILLITISQLPIPRLALLNIPAEPNPRLSHPTLRRANPLRRRALVPSCSSDRRRVDRARTNDDGWRASARAGVLRVEVRLFGFGPAASSSFALVLEAGKTGFRLPCLVVAEYRAIPCAGDLALVCPAKRAEGEAGSYEGERGSAEAKTTDSERKRTSDEDGTVHDLSPWQRRVVKSFRRVTKVRGGEGEGANDLQGEMSASVTSLALSAHLGEMIIGVVNRTRQNPRPNVLDSILRLDPFALLAEIPQPAIAARLRRFWRLGLVRGA